MKQVRQISLFVSSPGDLTQERDLVVDVCNEINIDSGYREGFHIAPLRWETNAYPTSSQRSQSAINKQIGDDYDIFLGLMGLRFGSETGVYSSGTQEEFERAYERNLKESKPKILFYFFSGSVSTETIQIEQFSKVKEFKSSIQKRGLLYWNYSSSMELRVSLSRHLQATVREILNEDVGTCFHEDLVDHSTNAAFDALSSWHQLLATDAEVAVTELAKELNLQFKNATSHINDLAKAIKDVGRKINQETLLIAKVVSGSLRDQTNAQRAILRSQTHLEEYSQRLLKVIPPINSSLEGTYITLQRMKNITFGSPDLKSQIDEHVSDITQGLISQIPFVVAGVEGLLKSAETWPDHSNLNFYKRKLRALHTDLISMLSRIENLGKTLLD